MFVSELLSSAAPGVAGHELLVELAPALIARATAWYEGRCSDEVVRELFPAYRQATAAFDANWKLTWVLPLLLEAFPDARVVHLVRDPRPNVRSCVELDYYGALADDPRLPATELLREWLRTNPSIPRPDWDRLEALEKNCAFWDETHRLAEAALAHHPAALRVRVEELADDHAVRRLVEFLGLPMPTPDALTRLRARRINPKDGEKRDVAALRPLVWSDAHDARVWSRCGARAARYGYAP
jgi:hypothetical protein